jgi:acyl-CoA synthetase (AMP-forming)/AMP-acid ligase II
VGELHIGGLVVIGEYLDDRRDNDEEDAMRSQFYTDDHGRWLATGDQVTMDEDGVVRVLGRYKDIIIRGGENISPAQLEAHLAEVGITVSTCGGGGHWPLSCLCGVPFGGSTSRGGGYSIHILRLHHVFQ